MCRDLPSANADRRPIAKDVARRVINQPGRPDLPLEDQVRILDTLRNAR